MMLVRSQRVATRRMVHTEAHLAALGINLPAAGGPKANYVTAQWQSDTVLHLSGHLPLTPSGSLITGRVGPTSGGLTLVEAQTAARWCALNLIATMQAQLGGDLDRVEQVVKLFGIVSSKDDFLEQHLVLNGASDLIVDVFGPERGLHARSAIGTSVLPLDIAVEVEAVIRVKAS